MECQGSSARECRKEGVWIAEYALCHVMITRHDDHPFENLDRLCFWFFCLKVN